MKINYRPEIDGLRSLAVLSVILYHTKIYTFNQIIFEGGFIGVDIFFVISGYLITSIILKEIFNTNSFSFKYFYERRIRRILPALLFVMLISISFAWVLILPENFVDFAKTIIYSLGFSSNFYFHYSGQLYGVESGLLKPFLHTWSLSVEEQFYIVFPILLLIISKYFRVYLIYFLIVGFLISLGLADWGSKNHPSFTFYILPTRGWELLAGSILAYIEISKGYRSKSKVLNNILPLIGLILIIHSIIFFNDKMFHPSLYTLSPILGVCLIIWFSNKNDIVGKLLSSKLFVGIGLISYSLYLWHYPVFAFGRILYVFDESVSNKFLFGAIVIILSIFSYNFIEKPFRDKKNSFKKLLIYILCAIIFLLSINLYIINKKGFESRFPKIFQDKLKIQNIKFNQKKNKKKIVLIGDSHASALAFELNSEAKKNNLSLIRYETQSYLKNFNFVYRKTGKIDKKFPVYNNKIDSFLDKNSDLIVILHNRWSYRILETYFDNKEGFKEKENLTTGYYFEPIGLKTSSQKEREGLVVKNLISQINNIKNNGHDIILVYPVPEMGFNVPRMMLNKYVLSKFTHFEFLVPTLSSKYDVFKKRNKLIFNILDSIEGDNIYRVYPHHLFCNKKLKDRCVANNKESFYYFDDSHLSLEGSKFVVKEIIKTIKQNDLNK